MDRYYRKAKASPERKAIQKAYELGQNSVTAIWVIMVAFASFVGFYGGYVLTKHFLNS